MGVAAYTFLSDSEVRDRVAAQAKATSRGFAAAAVMRVVGHETRNVHEPPHVIVWTRPPYRRFWGDYWGWGWGTVWAPGYLHEERIVKVETLIYSLEDDTLKVCLVAAAQSRPTRFNTAGRKNCTLWILKRD